MEMIAMNDGTIEYVADLRDFEELVEKYMGLDAGRWLDGFLADALGDSAYAAELEKEIEALKEYHRSVMKSIRQHDEKLGKLICEKELNRGEISSTVGAIGIITWREMNR